MNREEIWQFITITGAIALITGFLISFNNSIRNDVYDLVYDLITLLTFTSALLWIKKKILLIGYILFIISFNIQLVQNSIFGIANIRLMGDQLNWINIGFNIAAVVFYLIGFFTRISYLSLDKRLELNFNKVSGLAIAMTIVFQIGIRIF
jgi:hypothetical protein